MKNYTLGPDEVPLYQGLITAPGEAELLLTNLNLALIVQSEDGEAAVTAWPVADIKIYRDVPQIVQKGRSVEFFLTAGEMTVEFKSRLEAGKFMNAALELLTGKSKLARSAGKVKKALDDVNGAFGVNVLEETKNFGIDTVSQIMNNTKPSLLELIFRKKTDKKAKNTKQ